MKFKYNYPEKKLCRIEEDYFYEISEQNRQIEYTTYLDTKIVSFNLGENHYLLLRINEPSLKITVHYVKLLKNGESIHYEKEITRNLFQIEITFEFSEADRKEKK